MAGTGERKDEHRPFDAAAEANRLVTYGTGVTHSHYFDAEPTVGSRAGSFVTLPVGDRVLSLATDRGVFGGTSSVIDRGTAVLLKVAPPPAAEAVVLDLGCGYGPIASWAAASCSSCRVWAVDVNERAVALCAANASTSGLSNVTASLPDDVPADVRLDVIYSNPPIRIGKAALHSMLSRWLGRLRTPDGVAWLVVQRHLGADSLADWMGGEGFAVSRVASKTGYRVLRVVRDG